MSYLLGIVAVALFFLILHNFTTLDKKTKSAVVVSLLAMILFMYLYNLYTDKERERILDVVIRYNQGKTLLCKGFEVNSSTFSYSVGTQTFIGKENTPHYGVLIGAESCR